MNKQKITCDNCQHDLTRTTNCIAYRLRLSDESIAPLGGMVTAMMVYPTLKDGDCHFCGIGCLKMWVSKI